MTEVDFAVIWEHQTPQVLFEGDFSFLKELKRRLQVKAKRLKQIKEKNNKNNKRTYGQKEKKYKKHLRYRKYSTYDPLLLIAGLAILFIGDDSKNNKIFKYVGVQIQDNLGMNRIGLLIGKKT